MTLKSGDDQTKTWFTAAELAELALPGLSAAKRKVNELAAEQGWAFRQDAAGRPLARTRAGRGGGTEYHWAVLPPAAKAALVARRIVVADAPSAPSEASRSALWARWEGLCEKAREEARARLRSVDEVEALAASGVTRSAAVATAAARAGVSGATLWNWLKLIEGAAASDRLARLAPDRKGGGKPAEIHPEAWRAIQSDYLRPEKPTFASCYARLQDAAALQGWGALPHPKTLLRRIEAEVPAQVITLRREGEDALRRLLPPQTRTIAELHALECVNVDGHRWDVFVRDGQGRVFRPTMVAIQDVFSRKVLAWRVGETESAQLTRLAFADLLKTYGIPRAAYLDNGRAFASKWITGGAANRFRFKVREEEPLGLLTSLGVEIHWTLPYRGQSKPIERAFRDLCDAGAKHPAFAGAYTGNRPDAKPENYGSRAVELETFVAVVARVIDQHNRKEGRRTEAARGRSFEAAFAESYARSPIGKASPEQMRLALLAADKVRTDRKSGLIRLFGNSYWTPELSAVAGREVVVRFDPEALHGEIHVYDADGRYLASAPVYEAAGFADQAAATTRARLERDHKRKARAAAEALQLLTPAEVAALLPDEDPEDFEAEAKVVRPTRFRAIGGAALKAEPGERFDDVQDRNLDRLGAAVARLRAVE